jgi:hypothetical protein
MKKVVRKSITYLYLHHLMRMLIGAFVPIFILAASPMHASGQNFMKLQVIEWPDQCVSPADKEHALKAIEEYTLRYGPLSTRDSSAPEKFPFYPMGGTLYADVVTVNFVDLDPTGGLLDWDCTDYTYDGHDASDTGIRGFGEQQRGGPPSLDRMAAGLRWIPS